MENQLNIRNAALEKLAAERTQAHLWDCVAAFQNVPFRTASGLPFQYQLKVGRNGSYNKELLIDRRKESKSLAWSSVLLAYKNIGCIGQIVDRPKALGDIRGISYIYGIFNRFELIKMPEKLSYRDRKNHA